MARGSCSHFGDTVPLRASTETKNDGTQTANMISLSASVNDKGPPVKDDYLVKTFPTDPSIPVAPDALAK